MAQDSPLRQLQRLADQRRHVEKRAAVNRMKEKPCADCGQEYSFFVMDFDHRNPATKSFEISQVCTRKPWGVVLAEVEKCDVVCANCHRLRSWCPPTKPLRARQQLVLSLKGVLCIDCKAQYHPCQLDFDHTQGKKHGQVPKMSSLQGIRDEAAKCEIVCANCHRVRTQHTGRGNPRLSPESIDMVWKHKSSATPQSQLRHDGRPAPRPWHDMAGKMPDGTLARKHRVTRSAVKSYRERQGIPPFTPQSVKAPHIEVPYVY